MWIMIVWSSPPTFISLMHAMVMLLGAMTSWGAMVMLLGAMTSWGAMVMLLGAMTSWGAMVMHVALGHDIMGWDPTFP